MISSAADRISIYFLDIRSAHDDTKPHHHLKSTDRAYHAGVLPPDTRLIPLNFLYYRGRSSAQANASGAVEIVRKNPDQVGFAVNPRRWVVERFFAWIGRNRRLAKDFEATIDSARAFLYAASVMLLVRRIARAS